MVLPTYDFSRIILHDPCRFSIIEPEYFVRVTKLKRKSFRLFAISFCLLGGIWMSLLVYYQYLKYGGDFMWFLLFVLILGFCFSRSRR